MVTKSLTSLSFGALIAVTAPAAADNYYSDDAAAAAPAAGYGYGPSGAMPYRAPGHGWYRPGFGGYKPMPPAFGYPRPMYRPPYRHGYAPMRPPAGGYAQARPAPAAPLPQTQAQAEVSAEAAADSGNVTIGQMQFAPARITVTKGATVTWTQQDGMPHTVTASNGSFASPTLDGGGTFSQTFDSAGTYSYYCELHPSMRGEIVVVDEAG